MDCRSRAARKCSPGGSSARALGAAPALGNGTVSSYAEFDRSGALKAIGVVFSGGAFDNLPSAHSAGHHCFDADNDGTIDRDTESAGRHERVPHLPSEASRRGDVPLKWSLLNWNPQGHIPPGVYDPTQSCIRYANDKAE